MKWSICTAVLCAILASVGPAGAERPHEEAKLVKMVILARHGVRSPTQSADTLAQWSRRDWPEWAVRPGELTARGAELVKRLWQQEGESLRRAGLLPEASRPAGTSAAGPGEGKPQDEAQKGAIYVYADREERTQATAEAIISGLDPEGGLMYARYPYHGPDPLFHPVEAGYCALDPAPVERELSPRTVDELERSLAGPLHDIAALLGPASPDLCRKYDLPEDCTIADVPTRLTLAKENRTVHLEGGLGMGASAAEIFLLEYAQWPRDAGWGQVDRARLETLLPVHSRVFDAVNRVPAVASSRGSQLLLNIANALAGQEAPECVEKARLVIYVGHDTNIAAVSGLLDLHWHLPGYAPDEIPPGSALALSLWEKPDGEYDVRAQFFAQSLETLHDPNGRGEIVRQDLQVPWCTLDGPCPLTQFELVVRGVMRPECVRGR